jgi:ribosomal protein S18 acetylase RimI-like enzyme
MLNIETVQITRTNDPRHFDICAGMMAAQDPWQALGMDWENCRTAFEGSFREVHILTLDSAILAFVIIQPYGTFRGYIQTLCVHPDFQRKGLGKILLGYCETEIGRYSPNIFICVTEFNTGAHELYRKSGFEPVGELKNFLRSGVSEILLRKTRGPWLT